ncbi:hypothetical protein BD309DRAFT_1048639 [Dichomitus squalens]|uniref:Uncharacterized protein n=1 Tax=Dichomitus squalens TaxID=114155 RepID=A0A4Q9PQX7_9APHY|nr:hypothetical protein BD309DRAFT_1048639 [Dichomitus squalens]TBU56761.1 hypothetical protein BD310DRAFT_1022809 [Dichomitus squalens]
MGGEGQKRRSRDAQRMDERSGSGVADLAARAGANGRRPTGLSLRFRPWATRSPILAFGAPDALGGGDKVGSKRTRQITRATRSDDEDASGLKWPSTRDSEEVAGMNCDTMCTLGVRTPATRAISKGDHELAAGRKIWTSARAERRRAVRPSTACNVGGDKARSQAVCPTRERAQMYM